MPKGQFSRVPWPGNSWIPFNFQPALRVLQQPHKHSHSLQQAIHTQLAFNSLFLCPKGFLQSIMWRHQSTTRPLERAASHIKVTHPPCLFRLPSWENVNRSTTLIHCMWVMSLT